MEHSNSILPDGMEPCGKFWYASKDSANVAMTLMKPDPKRGPGFILNSFFCFDCDGFHVGHTREREVKDVH